MVSASYPLGYGKTCLTALGEMATAAGESSLGAQIAPQASEDLAVWCFWAIEWF